MLYIRDADGLDLTLNPPADVTVKAVSESGILYELDFQVVEDNTALPVQAVSATVEWSTGSTASVYPYTDSVNGTLAVSAVQLLPVGLNVIRVEGQNYVTPVQQVISVNFVVTVEPRIQDATPARVVFGPILPKDTGFPNNEQWNFTVGSDLEILASSVKMLLITGKGERVMEPDYGTNLRVLLFEHMAAGVEEIAQREIVEALTRWEPRVTLESVSVVRNETDRSVTVYCSILSKLDRQTFSLPLTFTP